MNLHIFSPTFYNCNMSLGSSSNTFRSTCANGFHVKRKTNLVTIVADQTKNFHLQGTCLHTDIVLPKLYLSIEDDAWL